MAGFGAAFGRLIREKRGIEGMSQEELAAAAGLTKARISELENGRVNNPHAKTVDALCVALNITREERSACHDLAEPGLPPRLLESLAVRFGFSNPDALEDELVAFLKEKALEFAAMQARLAAVDAADSVVAGLVGEASKALEEGEFHLADAKLAEAEKAHLDATTLPALEAQHNLRFERGHAALLGGDVRSAAAHWEAAANYFHFFDPELEAARRYESSILLREHAYRYRSADALFAAGDALRKNLVVWTKDGDLPNWCKAMNALGGVLWRLSQFDDPAKARSHLLDAKSVYAEVRESCSAAVLPYYFAVSGGNLANIYSDRDHATDAANYIENLEISLDLQLSAVASIDKKTQATNWGIFHHNIGCTYIKYGDVKSDKRASVEAIDQAISHLQLSFEVREPVYSLQYWIASCRSLAEALITRSAHLEEVEALADLQRAGEVLEASQGQIFEAEHPNQWGALKEQEKRLDDQLKARWPIGKKFELTLRHPRTRYNSTICDDHFACDRRRPRRI